MFFLCAGRVFPADATGAEQPIFGLFGPFWRGFPGISPARVLLHGTLHPLRLFYFARSSSMHVVKSDESRGATTKKRADLLRPHWLKVAKNDVFLST